MHPAVQRTTAPPQPAHLPAMSQAVVLCAPIGPAGRRNWALPSPDGTHAGRADADAAAADADTVGKKLTG